MKHYDYLIIKPSTNNHLLMAHTCLPMPISKYRGHAQMYVPYFGFVSNTITHTCYSFPMYHLIRTEKVINSIIQYRYVELEVNTHKYDELFNYAVNINVFIRKSIEDLSRRKREKINLSYRSILVIVQNNTASRRYLCNITQFKAKSGHFFITLSLITKI